VLLGCLYFFMLTAAFSENVFHTNGLVEVRAHAKRVTPACALPSPPFSPRLRNSSFFRTRTPACGHPPPPPPPKK
jgi:hypothetical protein